MNTKRALGCFVGTLIALTACSSSSSALTTTTVRVAPTPTHTLLLPSPSDVPQTSTPTMTSSRIEERIAFLSRPSSGNAELYLISIDCASFPEDCSNQLFLLADKANDSSSPSWSPDGKRIAFVSFGEAEYEGKVYSFSQVYVIDSDGSNEKRLVHMPSVNAHPKWSPDGSRIAFISWGRGVYLVNPDGSGVRALINEDCYGRCDFFPQALSWSPDSAHLAVDVWTRGGAQYIAWLDADSKTTRGKWDTIVDWSMSPVWSPDGKRIAFVCYKEHNNSDICTIDVHSNEETRLTSDPAIDANPTWSPDGSHLAFESDRDGNWEIYVMDADGSQQTNVTNNPAKDGTPTWSSDGKLIAFQSCRDDPSPIICDSCTPEVILCDNEIYIMNADGSLQSRLTNSPANDVLPVWAPR